jgi:hypothetical protein
MKSRQRSSKRKQRFSDGWQSVVLKRQDSTTNSTALSPEITKLEPVGQTRINPATGKPMYYKDNPETKKQENAKQMYVNGKYVPKTHPLYKAGRYKGFEDAAFSSLENYKSNPEGQVYIITNPAWEGWVKVGMAVDAGDRLNNYQTSSPFRDYTLVYTYEVDDRRAAESAAHTRLAKECDNINEWFKLPPPIANELILEVIHEY